ncbi:Methyl-accepting chemotaxis protein [Candidatus Rhodobacter oscarellae]|uniref:Methyl-accepting chemotaxis protein n=1 Tax=Candidatus Rhodobacter oscarellae TaxID=1675527 RepID=A0A0J9E1Z8_9RHOB|nr:Methyl-accepting chemotaxis protein [Candidatus Rhodobacter lobularis]
MLVSVLLVAALVALWSRYDCCSLEDVGAVDSFDDVLAELKAAKSDELFRLTTGVFVQSLAFESASDVRVTGRLWQRLPPGREMPGRAKLGVIFPDAITKHTANLERIYADFQLEDSSTLNVWNFQVVLRQYFDYLDYPLDGKLVWIRFWTNDVENQVQLIPDLGAYASTAPGSLMGISSSLKRFDKSLNRLDSHRA